MQEDSLEVSSWVFETINSKLFNKLLEELVGNFREYPFEVYIDFELKVNKVIIEQQFLEVLRGELSPLYFIKRRLDTGLGVTDVRVDLPNFLKYRKQINKIRLSVGSLVRFTIDGGIYLVEGLDLEKGKATISKSGTSPGVSLRVPLNTIVPTLKE